MDSQKWEYKVVAGQVNKVEKQINELAANGWEAVSLSATAGGAGASCLMKRVKAAT